MSMTEIPVNDKTLEFIKKWYNDVYTMLEEYKALNNSTLNEIHTPAGFIHLHMY